jgi:hypothetical protein
MDSWTVTKLRNAPMFIAEPLPNLQTKLKKQNQSRILAEKFCDVENFLAENFLRSLFILRIEHPVKYRVYNCRGDGAEMDLCRVSKLFF